MLSLTARHPRRGRRTLGTGCNGAPPDPTQLPAKNRILCDRHHIANAMAELVSYCRSYRICGGSTFLRLSPAHAGLFSPLGFLCREHHVTASGTISRFPHLLC